MADVASLIVNVDSRSVRRGKNDLDSFSASAGRAEGSSRRLGGALNAIGFAAAAAGLTALVRAAMEFESAMAEVSTLVDTAVVSMHELTAAARQAATTFGSSSTSQAQALYQIISAGASDAAQATEMLNAANRLAVGGVTDVATAADGLTSVMNAYGSAAGSATNVSDTMFVAMRAGKTTIGELSNRLGMVAPLAAQTGVSFQELTGSVAALTKGGQNTAVAVTGVRAILASVVKPTKEASDMAAELGLEFNAAALQAQGFQGFMQSVQEATGGSEDALAKLFGGVEALVPAMALTGQAGEDFAAIMEQMEDRAGQTDEAFEKIAATSGYQLQVMLANITETALQFASIISNALYPALKFINENFELLVKIIGVAVASFVAYKAAVLAAALASTPFVGMVVSMTAQFGLLAGAQVAAAGATGAVTAAWRALTAAMMTNPLGLVITAVGVLAATFVTLAQKQKEARAETDALFRSLRDLARQSETSYLARKEIAEGEVQDLRNQRRALEELQELRGTSAETSGFSRLQALDREKNLSDLEREIRLRESQIFVAEEAARAARRVAEVEQVAAGAASDHADAVAEVSDATSDARDALREYNAELAEEIKYFQYEEEYQVRAAQARELGNDALAAEIELRGRLLEKMNAERDAQESVQEFRERDLEDLRFEVSLLDMSSQARERAIAMRYLEQRGIAEGSDIWREYLDLISQLPEARYDEIRSTEAAQDAHVKAVEEQRRKQEEFNDALRKTIDLLDGLFGLNGSLGTIFDNLKIADPKAFKGLQKAFGSIGKDIADKFGKTFKEFIAGAEMGAAMGKMFAGISDAIGLPSSKTGGQVGGAIGGAAFGPIGAAVGSIVGSLGVGLLKGTKKASATIETLASNQVQTTITGNSKKLKEVADSMATSVINGLMDIADAFGGSLLEGIQISIGQRNKKFVVDPTGMGRTKGSGVLKFKDEEDAIAYATKLALENGVIAGIRDTTQRLLREGDDLQSALQDALDFENVFDRLLEKTDPLAFSLQQLQEEFDRLTALFDKAGASAAEYADLQQLYELERQEILDKAAKEQLDKQREISDLMVRLYDEQGNAAKSLALTRELELQKASEAEQVILRLIYAQEDLNEANREAARITESLAALNIRLLQAQGRTAEATAASRAQELEALSDGEKTILRQIYLLEDLNARRAEEIQALEQAESNLRSVYEREKRTLEETAQKFRDLASALREFSDTIFNTTRNPIQSLQALERQFFSTAREARLGNVAALEALPSLGGDLRDAVVDTATSRVEMIRKLAAIQRETDAAAEVAERQVDNAMTQLEALNEQVKLLIDINDSVMSVDEAIREFLNARAKVEATNAQIVSAGGVAVGPTRMNPAEEYAAKYFENVPNIKDIGLAMRYMSALAQQLVEQFGMPVGLVQQAHYAAQRAYSQADATSAEIASAFKSTIGFANGGMHSGGLRIVGENGPELEATGPTRIYNANQLGNMLNGGDTKEEVKALREEMRAALFQIAKNTGKTSDQLNRWDGDGLPSTRTWDAA